MLMQRGFRDKLNKYINFENPLKIIMSVTGNSAYDFCCFGVNENDKLSDGRYMIFYNQLKSPDDSIIFDGANTFIINLKLLPSEILKLVFTVNIDDSSSETIGQIQEHSLKIMQDEKILLELNLTGEDFSNERAIISAEIYKKSEWRIAAIAGGFNGGLKELLESYGGEAVESDSHFNSASKNSNAPVKLSKGQKISLDKNNSVIIIENGWTAEDKDYDLKALVRYRDGHLIYIGAANSDEQLSTPEGAVQHGGDVKEPGELEHIKIEWHKDIASVAVSSYSAIENGSGSFYDYGVFVRIKNGAQIVEIQAENASINEFCYTVCFGEIIFGSNPGEFEVAALEKYSKPHSEARISYKNNLVVMDAGPLGQLKI